MDSAPAIPDKPTRLDWTFRVLGFIALAVIAFALPAFPLGELDSSWRMALGQFFVEGRQFGTEVVFTYGPLGFAMGKTYWGGQWTSLIVWHAVQAVVFAGIVYAHAFRLKGYSRVWFLLFFFVFGLSYQDAMHQVIIAMLGLELIRRSDQPWRWTSGAMVALMVVLSLVKFTNMVLAVVLVVLAGALEAWTRRRANAARLPLLFLGLFLLGWVLCGQHLTNIPAYLRSSWQISQGYQDAMGFSCPPLQLYLGITVLLLLVAYTGLNFFTAVNRVRSAALSLGLGAFIYLNWKHGFIRADGHQIGFYYAALAVIVSSPILLEDGPKLVFPKRSILTLAALLSLFAMERVLPGLVTGALGGAQGEFHRNLSFALGQSHTRQLYDARLQGEKNAVELLKTKSTVGRASLDVLGFEQSVAIFNGFNYQPRPVFQGYSAYTPYLSRLNYEYFASDNAPEYILFKLQTIDGRLPTMDDPHALRILIQRYTYLFSELGYTLWQRNPGPFDADSFEPTPIRSATIRPMEKYDVSDLADQNIWVEIDYRLNLLGKLRRFFFKPPLVQLRITDEAGYESLHRLPQPIGQAGFMLNPVVNDLMDFMRAAGGSPKRRVKTISIETASQDLDCLKKEIKINLAAMPPSQAGVNFFTQADQDLFHMFVDAPSSYTALNPPNEDVIDKRRVMIMHAPSEMVFDVPAGAGELNGYYGFIPGAYTGGGKTNGAEFVIIWNRNDGEPVLLHERFLDPMKKLNDRGLQRFHVKLPHSSGQVILRVNPGPYNEYAFDWTGWTAIEFK